MVGAETLNCQGLSVRPKSHNTGLDLLASAWRPGLGLALCAVFGIGLRLEHSASAMSSFPCLT